MKRNWTYETSKRVFKAKRKHLSSQNVVKEEINSIYIQYIQNELDKIPKRVLKECRKELHGPLQTLHKKSLKMMT